jgi:2-keto-4-pentenoate hydratase/2-oxohepta-3-ene-1,7-dioic acid hydratase in catechol pathway
MHEVLCGDDAFVPTKILGVGKNFPEHAREMGGVPPPEPVLFLKPNSAVAFDPREIVIPAALGPLHHEVELCALVGRGGKDFSIEAAREAIAGFAVGIDLTLRERQAQAKAAGEPWALAKGFDGSAVLGRFLPAADVPDPAALVLTLAVNGTLRQRGVARDMRFPPAEILAFASRFMTIEPGDVFMCGTPAGVGEVQDGDRIAAEVAGLPPLAFIVRRPSGGEDADR